MILNFGGVKKYKLIQTYGAEMIPNFGRGEIYKYKPHHVCENIILYLLVLARHTRNLNLMLIFHGCLIGASTTKIYK